MRQQGADPDCRVRSGLWYDIQSAGERPGKWSGPPSGLYRLNINITVTAVASAGTITPQILFTDDAKAETISGTAFTATALGMTQVSAVIYSAGTANITAKCSTSGLTGTPTWNLRTSLERLSLGIV